MEKLFHEINDYVIDRDILRVTNQGKWLKIDTKYLEIKIDEMINSILSQIQNYSPADKRAELTKLLFYKKNDPLLYYLIACTHFEEKNYEIAKSFFKLSIMHDKERIIIDAIIQMCNVYTILKKDTKYAIKILEYGCPLYRNDILYNTLAVYYLELNDLKNGRVHLLRALTNSKDDENKKLILKNLVLAFDGTPLGPKYQKELDSLDKKFALVF